MWEKEEKEEGEDDEYEIEEPSPYKWPCLKCEIHMQGNSNTPYLPIGYRYLTENERKEIKKEKCWKTKTTTQQPVH